MLQYEYILTARSVSCIEIGFSANDLHIYEALRPSFPLTPSLGDTAGTTKEPQRGFLLRKSKNASMSLFLLLSCSLRKADPD